MEFHLTLEERNELGHALPEYAITVSHIEDAMPGLEAVIQRITWRHVQQELQRYAERERPIVKIETAGEAEFIVSGLTDRIRGLEAEIAALRQAARIGMELDNHHNADACPYCYPEKSGSQERGED